MWARYQVMCCGIIINEMHTILSDLEEENTFFIVITPTAGYSLGP